LEPQAIAWACLGLSLASYEQWLSHADADLLVLIDEAFRKMGDTWGEHP
ncbi:MAG TPA: mycofactocin system transcriptional regulator, partial [Microbacterium sp.]|nr:mycofactocin system transcriptional regulator [Microbacterium sp.]